jgi:hypothetical protein
MNLQRFSLLLAACACVAAAQPVSAPPAGLEESLRERIRPFYQAWVDGHYRKAYEVVAEDSKDAFITQPKTHYDGFEIQKLVFSNDYTTAEVTTEVHTTMYFYGLAVPEKPKMESFWKIVDGQWYWYVPPSGPEGNYTAAQRMLMGFFHVTPGAGNGNPALPSAPAPGAAPASVPVGLPTRMPPGMPSGLPSGLPPVVPQGNQPGGAGIPTGPPNAASTAQLLQKLRSEVTLDKNNVELRADQAGTAVVMVRNNGTGPVQIVVSAAQVPGLTVKSDKTALGANESATISITWAPAGSHGVPPPASCGVSVKPTSAFLPFTVTFR